MASKTSILSVMGVALAAVVLYGVVRSCLENDETRIRKVVYQAAFAVERKDLLKCASLVSDAYDDRYGNNKPALIQFVGRIFQEFEGFRVEIKTLKTDIKAEQASASIGYKAYFKKRTQDQLYYDAGILEVNFQKEEGRWRARRIEYKGMNELLFIQSVA